MLKTHHQNAGQSNNIKIATKPPKNVAEFRYQGTTVTNQNYIHEEIKRALNFGNASYCSVQKSLFQRNHPSPWP
jgi:uncharacterized OsmC-like protein